MILNRIELGTTCTVRENGQSGKVAKIFFYPTTFEVQFSDGSTKHYSSKDLDFDGIEQKKVALQLPQIPENGIGKSWSDWTPFKSESHIEHHFSTSKEIIWDMITSLDMYNVWFHGIQRALPIVESDRYVHKYSFNQLELKPGAYFKIRPMTIAPWFTCRVMTMEKYKQFGFSFKTTPFVTEYVHFSIEESELGVWITCKRYSSGLFSIIDQFNWQEKSKILQRLDQIVPKINFSESDEDDTGEDTSVSEFGGFKTRQDYIDYGINMGMQDNMDYVNGIQEKTIRGMVKAGIVKAKRTGTVPACPEKAENANSSASTKSGLQALSKDDQVAFLVNKGLDGDMDIINAQTDKVLRGKVKAMLVKIKRGSLERPAIPEINEESSTQNNEPSQTETDEQKMERLVAGGLEGDMDEINALDDRVLRGKIKAAIVKAKRKKA